MAVLIELLSVDVQYNRQPVLAGFSHRFPTGSLTVVTGPSGIGKTTLLRTIAGLLPLVSGQVLIGGQITDRPGYNLHPSQRQVGFVFQSPALWPHLTVRQNILYGLNHIPAEDAEKRLAEISTNLSLGNLLNRHPGELSGGQARRVSLARTWIVQPAYLLLDEPFNHLDQSLKCDVLRLIDVYRQSGRRTIIVVSHETDDIRPLADTLLSFHPDGLT